MLWKGERIMKIIPKILGVGFTLIVLDLYIKHINTHYSMTGTIPEPIVYPIISFIVGFVAFLIIISIVFSENLQQPN